MAGMFEIFNAEGRGFQFRLKAADGTVMALSRPFPDKQSAVAGIMAVRECAGMGLITDLCSEIPVRAPHTASVPRTGRVPRGGCA